MLLYYDGILSIQVCDLSSVEAISFTVSILEELGPACSLSMLEQPIQYKDTLHKQLFIPVFLKLCEVFLHKMDNDYYGSI